MRPEAARLLETRDWLAKCAEDLRAAEFLLTAAPPLTSDVVFHAQQLAEKSLKAFLTWRDRPYRKTHNLLEIGQQCVVIDPTLEALAMRASTLSEYAWKYRYPGEPVNPGVAEAQAAIALASEVYNAILTRLPDEAHL